MVRHACAAIACDYPNRTVAQDILQYSTDAAADLGFTALKVFLTPNYDGGPDPTKPDYPGQNWDGVHTSLVGLAQDSGFVDVFSDVRINRFIIDVWSFTNGIFNPWLNDISTAQLQAEYDEWYDLAAHLLSTYAGKEFILQSGAESDWAILGDFDPQISVPPYRVERYAAFLNVHQRACEDATRATPSTSRIVHAVEVNRVLDDYGVRMHRDVFPLISVDAISYTAYEAINTLDSDQATAEAILDRQITKAIRRIQKAKPGVRVYIGEYAWPQEESWFTGLGLSMAGLIQQVIDTSNALGVTDLVYWQIFDNEEQSPGIPRGFSLYSRDANNTVPGALNAAGTYYQSIL